MADLDFTSLNEVSLPPHCGTMQVLEYFLCGKCSPLQNEDDIFVNEHFAAVVDGATSKSPYRSVDGKTSGKLATTLVKQTIENLKPDVTLSEALESFRQSIYQFYVAHNLLSQVKAQPAQRFTASAVIYSVARQEIWQIGDCQCLINGVLYQNNKLIDELMAAARAAFLEVALSLGEVTLDSLQQHDVGRDFILPFLQRQAILQNHPDPKQPLAFAVLDGFKVDVAKVKVWPVPKDAIIVLASDGYPQLKESLQASEASLEHLLKSDPLCMHEYKSTKGLKVGQKSFDDRAYLKLQV